MRRGVLLAGEDRLATRDGDSGAAGPLLWMREVVIGFAFIGLMCDKEKYVWSLK